ncbi:endoplasmic reticulum aminopeptidase 2-like isoform X3 [Leptotrombidium deliense]|uniref:Aminopeptidase n=1 Tax=Leptotrombidium deliense TaxID=299467 RepID=A0A443SSV8_9ACAR|nr:endoplasmic reticulum aminopeptidase 2-like isoform X3 [Leptotrombidium deliense]
MMNMQIGELEIDDIAFLTAGDNPSRKDVTAACGSLCGTRRRYQKTNYCTILFSASFVLFVVIVALIVAFVNPFKDRCNHPDDSAGDASSRTARNVAFIATNGEAFPWTDIRLPNFIKPVHYDLFMHPNLTSFVNKGSVEILFQITQRSDFVVIHAKELNISEVSITDSGDKFIKVVKILEYAAYEQLYIQFVNSLEPIKENYTLKIAFIKNLEEKLEGFYISSYTELTTERKRYLATTHFEPTFARSAFPCFDEPALKATFALKMVHEPNHEVFFNSEKQTRIPYNNDGLTLSVFDDTVPMSTYLVAFVICDFKSLSARTKEGTHVRVVVPADQYNQAEYALYSATSILSYFTQFFNISYPLSKLDLVAVPDFGAGAMENWGLITFRTTTILFDEEFTSNEIQENVAIVVSHELAHQWFGNLVTMKWWNDIWLNEGFASYVENLGVNHVNPEWNMIDQFVLSTTQEALALDSLDSSHAIMANVTDPREIEAMFDTISYKKVNLIKLVKTIKFSLFSKGAALIRMLQNFLSTDILRLGLTMYLNKFQFRNAETQDLWKCFTDAVPNSSINVTAVMERWVRQKGFPVINVKSDRNKIYLNQKRFLSSPANAETMEENDFPPFAYQWIIPVTIITNKNYKAHRLVWFSSPNTAISLDYGAEWFKLNVNQTGFYRVNYDEKNWKKLIAVLQRSDYNRHVLSATDRANLIDDAFSLMKMDILSPDIAMNLSTYLEIGERDYVPWETALRHFFVLDTIMHGNPYLQKYVRKLLQPSLTLMGWKDDGTHLAKKLRSSLLFSAIIFEEEQAIRIAKLFFDEWMKKNYKVAPNLRNVVYTTGVRYGGIKEWDFCWKKYKSSNVPSEQKLLLTALSQTRVPWLLIKLLNLSLDKDEIKRQDTVQVITDVAHNPFGRLLAWRFVRENWATLISFFGQGSFSMESIITETSWHFSSAFDLKEVDTFYRKVDVGSGAAAVKQTLERIRANIFWKKSVEHKVVSWLQRVAYRN